TFSGREMAVLRELLDETARDSLFYEDTKKVAESFGWLEYKNKQEKCPSCNNGFILIRDPILDQTVHIECRDCSRTGKISVLKDNRERKEFEDKLGDLNLVAPW